MTPDNGPLPSYSVIIVSLNGAPRIGACLRALRETTGVTWEGIVVDNGSTDGLGEIVTRDFPEIRYIRAPRNLGFAGGNNLGAAHALGRWIVLLNDDTEVRPDWLAKLDAFAATRPRAGILGCLLLYPDGKTVQHAGGVIHANALTDHTDWGHADGASAAATWAPRTADYATGAAIAIRSRVWDSVGPLDPGYFPIYFEETEFCWRARRAGWEIWIVPASVVIHHESQTQQAWSRKFLVRYHSARLRFILRNWRGRQWAGALKAEIRWLSAHRPYDQLVPLAQAYARTVVALLFRSL